MRRKAVFTVLFLAGIYFSISLSRQIWTLWQQKDRLAVSQKNYEEAKGENEKLKSELEYKQSDKFLEEEARNKLNMAKEGEEIVILPKDAQESQQEEKKEPKKLANWQKWLNLLFD